ncbi:MAG: aminotransferase class I/II-fold pyridoxal phosphate-dependent enzyme [Flavobacteriaceae bacterium]|nr:aminotransferase class I/II-fold pyridoxal phosphate-dependent enzyme [Flavobacteriaceae bacterium]MDZ4148915.1 aminotransferase class I/II-fold pyridoxal phosphate-dependent enzyme [Flavobacteriaceae bacterium]
MPDNSKIWLSSPHMGGFEQSFVQEAFDTNWVAPLGPNVTGFELDLENYLNTAASQKVHIAALSSGTAALHLALIMLDVKPGDEVICQSMTFSASANPIAYLGAKPIFIDSEPETWNLCPDALEEAIKNRIAKGKKPKAIVAVHLYGMPCKFDEIRKIADYYQIPIVEDSAEALGSIYKGQKCGTLGDISILSFNGNKIITTSGGGALVAKTKQTKDKAVFLATQARDNAAHYQHSEIGYNYRLSNICAGIGRGQMMVLDQHIALRREMHRFYELIFAAAKGITLLRELNTELFSNHWLTAILIDPKKSNGKSREDVRLLLEQHNIESRPLWKPMHLQPVFRDCPYYGGTVAEQLFENGLCLPSGSNLTQADKQRIQTVLEKFTL